MKDKLSKLELLEISKLEISFKKKHDKITTDNVAVKVSFKGLTELNKEFVSKTTVWVLDKFYINRNTTNKNN